MSEAVPVQSCATKEEGELVKAMLEANNIHAMVSADDYIGLPLPTGGGVHVLVLQEDLERARELIEAAESEEE